MPFDYLRIDPATFQVIEHLALARPLAGYNSRAAAEANRKAFILPADRVGDDAFDAATQVKEGPAFEQLDRPRAVVRYTVRDKTAEELAADAAAAATAELRKTDGQAVAIGEELVALLIDKGVIATRDLSQAAQDLLAQRKAVRTEVPGVAGPRIKGAGR